MTFVDSTQPFSYPSSIASEATETASKIKTSARTSTSTVNSIDSEKYEPVNSVTAPTPQSVPVHSTTDPTPQAVRSPASIISKVSFDSKSASTYDSSSQTVESSSQSGATKKRVSLDMDDFTQATKFYREDEVKMKVNDALKYSELVDRRLHDHIGNVARRREREIEDLWTNEIKKSCELEKELYLSRLFK